MFYPRDPRTLAAEVEELLSGVDTLAPRLGVSYPVTAKSSLFFAYGHFYQMPQLGQILSASSSSPAPQASSRNWRVTICHATAG